MNSTNQKESIMNSTNQKESIMKYYRSLLLILVLGFSINFWSSVSLAAESITVYGKAQVSKAPDKVRLQATIITESSPSDPGQAVILNAGKMEEVFDVLKNLGIKETDMQTVNFNVSPLYDRSNQRHLYAYEVSNSLSFCIRELDKVGEVLTALGQAGVNKISGLRFEVDDPTQLLSEARAQAMINARKHAEEYAKVGGFQIGQQPLSVDEGGTRYSSGDYAESAPARGADVPIALGEISYSANITVIYEILSTSSTLPPLIKH